MAAVAPPPDLPIDEDTALPWDAEVADAVAEIEAARARHGDEFVVHSGRAHYLFTFSPVGVESFYALPESSASKGVADYLMLRRKLPQEVFDGRRMLPSELFTRDRVEGYLEALDAALEWTDRQLGPSGEVDLFGLTRRIGHRMGLNAWGGAAGAEDDTVEAMMACFDDLDGAAAFVHPDAMAQVRTTDHARERAAYERLVELLAPLLADSPSGLARDVVERWQDEPPEQAMRGAAGDVALIHIASMSNLHAAIGWMLLDLLTRPEAAARVREGDADWTRRCALESTRLAQRSIMARHVMAPVTLETASGSHVVPSGWTVATLLPPLNTGSAPGLATLDPDRWQGYRLTDVQRSALASPTLVTAFGHGRHSCPAQPFSLTAMSRAAEHLLGRYDVSPLWDAHPTPVAAQIGGIARASDPCPVTYRSV